MSDARYNVAVIGCGRIAREHVAGYEKNGDRFAIKAFVSRDRSRAADFVRQYGTGTSYASLAEAASVEKLDAVDICLPPSKHCPLTVQAAELGLHVLVEKPLAITCREVDEMIEAGRRNGTIIMSGQSRRFNGPLRKAKELLDSGRIGKPLLATISYGMKVDLIVPWWGDATITGPSNLMANWGTHSLDELFYLYGPPARIYAEGRDTGGPTAGIDLFSAVFGYESGFVANMNWSYVSELANGQAGKVGDLLPTNGIKSCMGTQGTLRYGQNVGPTGVLLDGEPVPNDDTDVNQFHTMIKEFHAAITEQRPPETSAFRCRVVIEMAEAILESCTTHQVVPVVGTSEENNSAFSQ
jgi:predicted dehydrogenase